MATVSELIAEKTRRLTTVPDEYLTAVEIAQKKLFPQIVDILRQLTVDSAGNLVLNSSNLALASDVKQLVQQILSDSEYITAVQEYAKQMGEQAKVSNDLFAKTFDDFTPRPVSQQLLRTTQRNAVDLLVNAIGNQRFADVVRENIETAISSNAGFTETVKQLQTIVTGDDEVDGKLLQYNKQIAHDTFAIADRNYTSAVSEELEAEWFFYSGSEIETTRPFCSNRHNKYFYYKEIEDWPTGDYSGGGVSSGQWIGQIPGTNSKTIYSYAGGYNCRHSIIPVSIRRVPETVVREAIQKWGFEPTQVEAELLGI
jgi:hypothetical protein